MVSYYEKCVCFLLSPLSISRSSTSVFQHMQILPREGGNVLYYLNISNSKLSLPLFWTKGELREPICGDELWRTPDTGAEQARQNLLPQNQWQPTGNPLTMDGLATAHGAASEKSEW